MARDADTYGAMIQQLAPPGLAWSRDPESEFGQLCAGLGEEFARVEARSLVLIEEAFPDTTNEMLPDWERTAGLPDPAIPAPVGNPARLAALADRLTGVVSQNAVAYEALAVIYGYTATITYHRPFWAGVACAGDPVYVTSSTFWWEYNITCPIGTTTPIVALEHAVRRRNQLHRYVTFNYIFV